MQDEGYCFPESIEYDPYTVTLYRQALQEGTEKDYSIRINVVGNFAQGKTSLVRRLVGQNVQDVESTNGIDVQQYMCKRNTDGNISYTQSDLSDNTDIISRLAKLAREHKCSTKELDSSSSSKAELLSKKTGSELKPDIQINKPAKQLPAITKQKPNKLLFGRKKGDTNLLCEPRKKISPEILQTLDSKQSIKKESVLSDEEICKLEADLKSVGPEETPLTYDFWDFGGQYIFYATHTLFHSRRAIYLLVFDLSVCLDDVVRDEEFPAETGDKNMEYFIRFWMNSIHSFVGSDDSKDPPVILVGTHKDKLPGDDENKARLAEQYFENVRRLFDDTQVILHIQPEDFSVDNTDQDDQEIKNLRLLLSGIGKDRAKEYEIPAKWLALEKALRNIRNRKIVSIETIMDIDKTNEISLKDEKQIKLFLQYYHAKGTLVYFDEKPISDFVVLDTQYLIDAFKCIITSERFCRNHPEIRSLWQKLIRDATLQTDLIDEVWKSDKENDFMGHKDVLLQCLQKHHIISEVMDFDETNQRTNGLGWYVVPSLLKTHISPEDRKKLLENRNQTSVRFVMMFQDSAVVHTVHNRLLAASLGKWSVVRLHKIENESLLFEDLGVFRLDISHAAIIESRNANIELTVLNLCPSSTVDSEITDYFRRFSELVVGNEFRKLRGQPAFKKLAYTRVYRCNHESHGLGGSKDTNDFTELDNRKSVPCPDLFTHEIFAEKAKCQWYLHRNAYLKINTQEVTEKQLSRVAKAVGRDWELLGLALGLAKVQIDHISFDNQTTVMKIFSMLMIWKKMKASNARMDTLIHVMQDCKHVEINWDEIRNINDGLL